MKQSLRALIIDDDPDVLDAIAILLEDDFIVSRENSANRIQSLALQDFDIILLDMNFSAGLNTGNEGLYWLSKILEIDKCASVIMMTAYGNIALAVEAIKRGAKDFILKPWENDKLLATIRTCLRKDRASRTTTEAQGMSYVEGVSPPMLLLQEQMRKVAATEASVLLLGENGTGKEVVAKEIHRLSNRASSVFLSVDLSTLSSGVFESELFGHKKGAYTDAKTDRIGRFESANGGTLFLDEIGNIAIDQQVKLLTVLQSRQLTPVGSNERVTINVRIISATNAPLLKMTEQGLFRQDLLYRLNTVTLEIPPLRVRQDDIISLANHFLKMFGQQYKKENPVLTEDAQQMLLKYNWPGNVRELKHTIEKAVILGETNTISSKDLNLVLSSKPNSTDDKTLEGLERQAIVDALSRHGGNIVHAAKALGITRQTFYNKMKKYGL
jgi:two-component system response regulator HydG